MKIFLKNLLFILFLFISINSFSQKVGLVLSGGGAKGLAHIGVIRALEENNIPIDYITGTSMGAIIGGLYAIGYTPDEMELLLQSKNFENWSTGKIDEKYIYFFKKKEENAALFNLKFTKVDSILNSGLPTNLIPTNQMDFAFLQLFSGAAAAANYNFNNLFVPFRCVATDIYNSKPVYLSKGDLGSSIRASMTFPFYFKPISIDEILLFDGGLMDNFPTGIMKQDFSPDIIIGSKVAKNSEKPDEDDVYIQLENMVMGKTDYYINEKEGILIETSFTDVSLLDFDRTIEISQKGYNSAILQMEQITKRITKRIDTTELNQKRKLFKSKIPKLYFQDIIVNGLKKQQTDYVNRVIRQNKQIFSVDQFSEAFFKLIADDRIASIYPTAIYNKETGYFDLLLKIKLEKPSEVQIGGNIASSSINQAYVGLTYRFLRRNATTIGANVYYGRLYSSLQVNGRRDFNAPFPFYFTAHLVLNRWDFFKSSNDLFFEDVRPSYLIQDEVNLRGSIGFPIMLNGKFETGIAASIMQDEYYQTKVFMKADTADKTNFNLMTLHALIQKNTLNYNQYPSEGVNNLLKVRYIQGIEENTPGSTSADSTIFNKSRNWINIKYTHDAYYKFGRYFSLGLFAEGVYSNKPLFNNYTSSILSAPAFYATPHSQTLFLENYRANSYMAGGIKSILKIITDIQFRVEGFVFQPYQKINEDINHIPYYGNKFKNTYFTASASVIYQTIFGPTSLSLNYYNKDEQQFYVLFHFGYILFNKKAID